MYVYFFCNRDLQLSCKWPETPTFKVFAEKNLPAYWRYKKSDA